MENSYILSVQFLCFLFRLGNDRWPFEILAFDSSNDESRVQQIAQSISFARKKKRRAVTSHVFDR